MFFNDNKILDIKTNSCLKGILACMVLICHLHARVSLFSTNILGTIFTAFGYLAVSVFFFLSGYGLHESSANQKNYIEHFPKKKLLPFFLICAFTILIYLSRDILVGNDINAISVLQSFLFGGTIVDNGWYLQSQLLFYLIFYILYKFVKSSKACGLNIIMVFVFIFYCIICATLKMPTTWYEAGLCFPLGALYSQYKEKINSTCFKRKNFIVFFICIFAMFILALFLGNKQILITPLRIFVKIVSSLLFCVLCVMTVLTINIKNIVTSFFGKISLEIYVLQGIFLNLFKKTIIIKNDILYIAIVIICTILSSLLLHPVYERISKIAKNKFHIPS